MPSDFQSIGQQSSAVLTWPSDAEPACLAGDPAEISEPPSMSRGDKRGVACAGGCV